MNRRAVAYAIVAIALPAHAGADRIAIEVYTGQRPADAGDLVGPVLAELAAREFGVSYDGVGKRFETAASRPGKTAAGIPPTFVADIDRGHQAWARGKFDEAIATLTPLIDAARANPAGVVEDQPVRAAIRRGLLALALSHHGRGETDATRAVLGDLVRSFPDFAVSRATHGPEAFELYQATRKQLDAEPRGGLEVVVSHEGSAVFLNETFVRLGSLTRSDLAPGTYRVYASLPPNVGRIYTVAIQSGQTTKLTIDWSFDGALRVSREWTGFSFANAEQRTKLEAPFAARFAMTAGAKTAAIVGLDSAGGRRIVVGSVVDAATNKVTRRATIAAQPAPSPERLRALARFLAGDDSAGGELDVEISPTLEPRRRARDEVPASRWGWKKYGLAAGGVVVGAAGAILIAIDGQCTEEPAMPTLPCPELRATAIPGYITAGVGVAALGLAVWMFVTDKPSEHVTVSIVPTVDGALASARVTF